jgi:hemolysin D
MPRTDAPIAAPAAAAKAETAKAPAVPAVIPRRNRQELEFLPAALEIVETPPSPASRVTALTMCAFLGIAATWAWFGHIDVVAVAEGRIVPNEGTKLIQPMELGVVRAIHVTEGQSVRAGDVLIEMDPTESGTERDRLAREALELDVESARLRATVNHAEAGTPARKVDFTLPEGADARLAALHRDLMRSKLAEHQAKLSALDSELSERRAERAATAAELAKERALLPLIRERVNAHAYLATKDLTPKLTALELRQELVEAEQNQEIQTHNLARLDAAVATLQDSRRQAEQEFRAESFTALAEAERRLAATRQELIKAEDRHQRRSLSAPIDGVVQQLDIHTIGGVVTPAQKLMVVVPRDARLDIEALVLNKDVGFVREGQEAEIKVETFPFTKYGLLRGTVLSLSRDSVTPSPAAGAAEGDRRARNPEGPVYAARVSMDRTVMAVDGRDIPLGPGMAVSVEIKTDQRRVIDFLLAPLLRYKQESLRER